MDLTKIPSTTIDFITYLEQIYPDVMETDPSYVGTPEYWKKAGVVELINKIKLKVNSTTLKGV